jgi:hypothetical protein
MNTFINFIVALYSIFILVCRITFYKKLTKTCECPIKGWELKYTEYFTYVLIAFSVLGFIVNIFKSMSTSQKGGASQGPMIFSVILMLIILIAWFIDVYCIHKLRNKLIEDDCECDKNLREIIYYSTWISGIVYLFLIGLRIGFVTCGLSSEIITNCRKIQQQYILATQRLKEELNKR